MDLRLIRATIDDAEQIWNMQRKAFSELLERYQDFDTNPGNESLEKVKWRFQFASTYFYLIQADEKIVGAIRVLDRNDGKSNKKIAPIFVLPEYWNKGIAQAAIREAERMHGSENWELDTILQEKGNCHLYEKMGYRRTGKTEIVNEKLTLVFYEK